MSENFRRRKSEERRRMAALPASVFLIFTFCFSTFAQSPVRLAIADLIGDESGEITATLRSSAGTVGLELPGSEVQGFEIIDTDLTRAAARGSGYAGNLNMSLAEARAFGQSLGCDYYIIGKTLLTRRTATGDQHYFEALAGIFIVETRTGQLIWFEFERAQSQSEPDAQEKLKALVAAGWRQSAATIVKVNGRRRDEIAEFSRRAFQAKQVLIDEVEESGAEQPKFYQRLKPAYTEQAELAGITATVELEAVFNVDGRVTDVDLVRWAGFGLDQSSIETVRMLRFKPADRDGKKLTIRGLVRYNFRRPQSQAARPPAQSPEEIDRLKRRLRDILKPGQKPLLMPD